MTSLYSAVAKPGFFWSSVKGKQVLDPGPFWDTTDERMVGRCVTLMNFWFVKIRSSVPEWWDAGSGPGGGLAMNDGVSIAVDVLRSVVEHLKANQLPFHDMSLGELKDCTNEWADALAAHFAAMSDEERRQFRALRGNQGHAAGVRHAQRSIQARFAEFQPSGLAEFLERENARTNDTAISIINEIERQISRITIGGLKAKWDSGEEAWWYQGVPRGVRADATARQNDDQNQRGAREKYLDFIHYREIVHDNWLLFGDVLAPGKQNQNKSSRTDWMDRTNKIRQIAAHGSSGTWVSFEELDFLKANLEWLKGTPTPTTSSLPDQG